MSSGAQAADKQEQFEYWLADMDAGLQRLKALLPAESRAKLDFSPDSLGLVERWVLDTWPDTADMQPASEAERVDAVARYIGETFRKHLGGRWFIELADTKNAYHGLPQLRDMAGQRSAICPLTLATASADRRTGTYLRGVFDRLVAHGGRPART